MHGLKYLSAMLYLIQRQGEHSYPLSHTCAPILECLEHLTPKLALGRIVTTTPKLSALSQHSCNASEGSTDRRARPNSTRASPWHSTTHPTSLRRARVSSLSVIERVKGGLECVCVKLVRLRNLQGHAPPVIFERLVPPAHLRVDVLPRLQREQAGLSRHAGCWCEDAVCRRERAVAMEWAQ
jgi:hypothetical protein